MTTVELDVSKWQAWRPEHVARTLSGLDVPWYVAGGWALDLFLGRDHRRHGDLEIAVPNERFDEIAEAFADFELLVVTAPGLGVPLEQALDRLADAHQTWVRRRGSDRWLLDIFREPSAGGAWICRRELTIRLPYSRLIEHTADGIPYGRPEVILLFKAKHAHEEKNRADLARTLPRLEPDRRRWLRDALARVEPGHVWLTEL